LDNGVLAVSTRTQQAQTLKRRCYDVVLPFWRRRNNGRMLAGKLQVIKQRL